MTAKRTTLKDYFLHIFCKLFLMCLLIGFSQTDPASAQHWEVTETPHFKFYYEAEDQNLIPSIQYAAERSVDRISSLINHHVDGKTSVYLVSNPRAFSEVISGQVPDWGVGFAIASRNLIILLSPRYVEHLIPIEQIVQHEYAHIVLGQKMGRNHLPRWFDEGLAMYLSHEIMMRDSFILTQAVVTDNLIPMEQLEFRFPHGESQARLAYLQSHYALLALLKKTRESGLQRLLDDYERDPDIDRILMKYVGMERPAFYRYCQEELKGDYGWFYLLTHSSFLWIAMTFLFLFIFVIKRFQTKQRLEQMEQLENQEYSTPAENAEPENPSPDYS